MVREFYCLVMQEFVSDPLLLSGGGHFDRVVHSKPRSDRSDIRNVGCRNIACTIPFQDAARPSQRTCLRNNLLDTKDAPQGNRHDEDIARQP